MSSEEKERTLEDREDRIFGSYLFINYANKGKIEKVKNALTEYRKTAKDISKFLWNIFFHTGKLPHRKKINIKHIPSYLSERYKYVCLWQAYDVLSSYIANIQYQFANIVFGSSLSKEDKLILLALNNVKGWLIYDKDEIEIYEYEKKGKKRIVKVSEFHRKLAKKIFKHLLGKNRRPRFNNISMHLDGKVVEISKKEKDGAKSFDYWIKISTLEKGKPIYIPLKANTYAEKVEGEFLNYCQVIENDGKIEFRIIKQLKKKEYTPLTDEIAIDLGLNPLFATDKGDLFGRSFFDILKAFDKKITKRMASLQKRKIKPRDDKKYRKYRDNLRDYLKNEINRLINVIVETYKPKRIIIERLDFRSPELSKRLNRMIQNFGKRYIKQKLERLQQLYGIEIIEINPAYTSQECSSCGYIDKKNRKDTQEFECKVCGNKTNAQVNGAKNILKRSSLGSLYLTKKQVLKILIERYLERHKGCKSPPLDVIKGNPYFKDYLDSILNPCQNLTPS
ncbi:transposase, IS605 OrfB family [Sulfurihydrogenibium sp. YO3AOP1]|uniref:RNA-guided endonuclease InsQ/TnpB family protein n=1 Tax=Sulfurihydrogenibium sp. (strain YO3AOP1) TaxID=436114 RepID=UPI000172388D|nr:RNA-guided endonuclease TnpB family protein [Sulfurihydrogenibium sp. YO3AOP1]ACD66348.1 transposase, IS605 OrfB family [Sulfurihydrogenibium sp. YO3AOP1]